MEHETGGTGFTEHPMLGCLDETRVIDIGAWTLGLFCWVSEGREERLDPHAVGVKQRAGTLVHPGGPLKLIQGG